MSAAAPAPDRRVVLGGSLGLAAALTAAAAPAALAARADPDAALFALAAQLAAAEQRQEQHDQACGLACDRYDPPPIPDALFFRPEDHGVVFSLARHPSDLAGYDRDGRTVPVYEDGIADLGTWVARYLDDGTLPRNTFPSNADLARVREIAAAHEAWQKAILKAEDAAGVTAARAGGDREQALIVELMHRITATPATTAAGLQAKARIAVRWFGGDEFIGKHIPDLLARQAGADLCPTLQLAAVLSVVVDAARLGMLPAVIATEAA